MPTERLKLTETACKNAPAEAKLWNTEIKGFGLFAGKTRKTFYYQKDVHGKTTRTKLGTWPETRLADARYEAAQLVAQYASGAVAKRLRAERIPTLDQATDDYIARPKLRSEHNKAQVRKQMSACAAGLRSGTTFDPFGSIRCRTPFSRRTPNPAARRSM